MSNFSTEDVVKALGNLSVLELIALTKELETKWGVEAKPQAVEVKQQEAPKEVQTEFSVILLPVSAAAKMNTIKLVRELLTIGLKEAKDFVEQAPKVVKDGIDKAEADALVARLTEVGAVCEIR